MPSVKRWILAMLSRISSNLRAGSLEGTNDLTFDCGLNARLERSLFHEIDCCAEEFADFVLDVDDVEERERPLLIEDCKEIDVGNRTGIVASNRAKQGKANYPLGAQLAFMMAQDGKDLGPAHAPIVAANRGDVKLR
jgi:hypothetical protein